LYEQLYEGLYNKVRLTWFASTPMLVAVARSAGPNHAAAITGGAPSVKAWATAQTNWPANAQGNDARAAPHLRGAWSFRRHPPPPLRKRSALSTRVRTAAPRPQAWAGMQKYQPYMLTP
jgi:hypothetical protein